MKGLYNGNKERNKNHTLIDISTESLAWKILLCKDDTHVSRDAVKSTGTNDMDSLFDCFLVILKLHFFQELFTERRYNLSNS